MICRSCSVVTASAGRGLRADRAIASFSYSSSVSKAARTRNLSGASDSAVTRPPRPCASMTASIAETEPEASADEYATGALACGLAFSRAFLGSNNHNSAPTMTASSDAIRARLSGRAGLSSCSGATTAASSSSCACKIGAAISSIACGTSTSVSSTSGTRRLSRALISTACGQGACALSIEITTGPIRCRTPVTRSTASGDSSVASLHCSMRQCPSPNSSRTCCGKRPESPRTKSHAGSAPNT